VFEAQMQHESANEQAHGDDAGGVNNNDGDVGGVNNNDGGAREGDAGNFDNLKENASEHWTRNTTTEKGLENLERMKNLTLKLVMDLWKCNF